MAQVRQNPCDANPARPPWTARVLTLFPEMFPGPLGFSLAGQALEKGRWALETVDIRSFASDKHRSVDDAPFGGGPGMVMRPDVLAAAIDATVAGLGSGVGALAEPQADNEVPLICLSPRGRLLDQARLKALAAGNGVVLVCGRFEGIDERVIKARGLEELSLGDFVLSGGEPAALALIDAVVRLLPGVVGDPQSLAEDSFERGLLEYPQYTRPQEFEGHAVPDVLLSGHHENVAAWRLEQAERTTRERRQDMWQRYATAKQKTE
ncbi:MAG TPA: tRNA (guanosine(37)-N1)-methyltransferase TrmD [Alphaproteobacteria bacterium]|jgi:tRNA (guanine37-N1)-methyltransferase|nr:tRNA (guanosine(37)-N1)-methyltransferase TrmD [Alphaproteobacteria bacterium]